MKLRTELDALPQLNSSSEANKMLTMCNYSVDFPPHDVGFIKDKVRITLNLVLRSSVLLFFKCVGHNLLICHWLTFQNTHQIVAILF